MEKILVEADNLIELTAEVVAAYVGNAKIQADDNAALIKSIHETLEAIEQGATQEAAPERVPPAVPIKKSIAPDYLTCLEDGRKFKSLKRHLRTKYDMTPDDYRTKWGLPRDYPMVAPNYALARSNIAKEMGLGQGVRKPATAAAKRGRKA